MLPSRRLGLLAAAAFGFASLTPLASAQAVVAYSVDTRADQLYSIDLGTGLATAIGMAGDVVFDDVEGLSFQPGTNTLFGLDDESDQLITIDIVTGVGTAVGSLGFNFGDAGLAFAANGDLFAATDLGDDGIYQVDPVTGAATLLADNNSDAHALAFFGGAMYGIRDNDDNLYTIDLLTGAGTAVGPTGIITDEEGLIFDAAGNGFLVAPNDLSNIYTVDRLTGAATFSVAVSCAPNCRFEGLAIPTAAATVSEPAALGSAALALFGTVAWARRRKA